jgi:hypothetical protein
VPPEREIANVGDDADHPIVPAGGAQHATTGSASGHNARPSAANEGRLRKGRRVCRRRHDRRRRSDIR